MITRSDPLSLEVQRQFALTVVLLCGLLWGLFLTPIAVRTGLLPWPF